MNKDLDNSELFCILVKTKRSNMASKLKRMMGNNAHWTINKYLAKKIGLNETLVLQHLIDWSDYHKKGEIFQTYEQMIGELSLSEYSIKQAVKKLKELNLISVERKGIGYKNYYLLNEDEIYHILQSPTSEVNSTHWSEKSSEHTNSTMSEGEINSPVNTNSTMSEGEINSPVNTNSTMSEGEITTTGDGEIGRTINKNIANNNIFSNNVLKKNIVKQRASVSSNDSTDGEVEDSPVKYSKSQMDKFYEVFGDS